MVPKMGLPGGSFFWDLGSFFKVFCIRLQKCFGFLVTLWLLGTGPETNLYVVIFCLFHGSAFALNFTISFLGPPGPISGTVFNHFSKFFVSELQKCNVWVAIVTLWLMATDGQLGRPF